MGKSYKILADPERKKKFYRSTYKREDNIKMVMFRRWACGLDLTDLGQGPMVGFYEHGD